MAGVHWAGRWAGLGQMHVARDLVLGWAGAVLGWDGWGACVAGAGTGLAWVLG